MPERRPGAGTSAAAPLLALVLVQICFGTFPVTGKLAMREMTPLVLASFRAVIGGLFLVLLARVLTRDAEAFTRDERLELAGLSLLGIVANQVLFISGLARTTATRATLLVATIPVFTLLAEIALRRARPSLRKLLGIPVALSGIVFLLGPGALSLGGPTLAGDLLVAANSVCYSLYLVLARPLLVSRGALPFTAKVFQYGALPILLVALPDLARFRPATISTTAWLAAGSVVLFSTVLAYSLTGWALARVSASTTAVFIYLQPVIAGSLAWLFLGEKPTPRLLGAAALIFTGVAFATWPEGRRSAASRGDFPA